MSWIVKSLCSGIGWLNMPFSSVALAINSFCSAIALSRCWYFELLVFIGNYPVS